MTTQCPDTQRLQTLLESDGLDDPEGLYGHLESCAQCRHTLESLAGDTTVWEGTATGLNEAVRKEPALHELMVRLKAEETPIGEDEVLRLLEPSEKDGVLGVLCGYDVLEVIGRGSMAVVFKAVEPELHLQVALKVLSPRLASSDKARIRFHREARTLAAIHHENVIQIFSVNEKPWPCMAMQYTAGESLQDRINRLGPLEVDEIVRVGLQTARGLAAAHRQGVIHRDVKPGNLMLSSTSDPPIVKITDFGLARAIDDSNLTHHGTVIGTPEYMSPEQARGETVDPRSDLFSLGSVLYAMATGSSPFRADSAMAVLRRVCDETPTPVRAINPRIPEWLATLIGRLLAKNRDDRIATAAEVADLLQGYLAHLQNAAPAPALGPAPVQSEAAVRVKRIRARGVVLLSASILLAAIFAVLLLRNSPALHANDWRVVAVGLGGLFCLLALGMIVFLLRWKPADPLQSVRPAGRAFTESAKVFMDLQCPGCQKAFKVQAAYRGNSVKCPSCGAPTSLKNESQTDTDRHR